MGAGPVDLSATGALHKLGMRACDIGWDCERGFLMGDHYEGSVACCTAACGFITEVKIKVQLRPELPELVLQLVADDKRVATSKDLSLHEVAIPGEEPPLFCHNTRDQRFISNDLFVGCIVSERPEPAGQPAEHGIGEECRRWNDLCIRDFIDHFICHEQRISSTIESVARRITHGKQSVYSLYNRHQSSQCNCRAGRLFSSSSEDLAAIT
jgi:hypothetical protein